MFIAGLFTMAKPRKQPKCPSVDEWVKRTWDICTTEYYSAMKKKGNGRTETTRLELENITISEEKGKCCVISKEKTKTKTKENRVTDTENKRAARGTEGGEPVQESKRYKLPVQTHESRDEMCRVGNMMSYLW